ncbi:unnamed protein product [Arctia plantaginis]|uniref:Neurotransmitter-gated ion-channel ligand-binding domain-containing protein n=1 Tax=Arctia plantaginis TaxID=874455 RepID=A0A8S0ZXU4_ARCPL|nr:unnamed protein product [Arctia plantaginis]
MSRCDIFYTLCVLLALTVTLISCDCPDERKEQDHDESRLNNDLLCAYNYDSRPVKDHKSSIEVSVRLALKYISFDSLEETFTVHSWVGMMWQDEFLTWIPSDYGNIEKAQLESHRIWTPRMALYNADPTTYPSDQIYTTCLVTHEGVVTCVPHIAHSGICRTTLRKWPYDMQNCTLYFGSWMNTGEQVNYTFYKQRSIIRDDFQDGPGWKLLDVIPERLPGKYSCCPNNTYPMLKYTFMLKRIAAGPAAMVVVPSVVIVMLTLISLVLDVRDNIRLVLICFSLYGHFTFLTEIGYQIPKHSADTPIILLFLRDSMIVTVVGIFETLLLMYLRRQVTTAPGWIISLNRLVKSGPAKYVVFTEFDQSELGDTKNLTEDNTNVGEEKASARVDWIQFANLLNSALFIVAVVVYFVLICVYIPYDK